MLKYYMKSLTNLSILKKEQSCEKQFLETHATVSIFYI